MTPWTPQQLLEAQRWRYATRVFDPTRIIPPDVWSALEQVLVLTPSSFGLQPYRCLVLRDPAVRQRLLAHSWNQRQVVDASHYVVLAARTGMTEAEIDRFVQRIAEVRGVPTGTLAGYRRMITSTLLSADFQPSLPHWAAHQAYIALGNLMTSAAVLGVDACPMEGFEPEAYDAVLDLPAQGLHATVACALGYRAATDKYARFPKVRLPAEELVRHLGAG